MHSPAPEPPVSSRADARTTLSPSHHHQKLSLSFNMLRLQRPCRWLGFAETPGAETPVCPPPASLSGAVAQPFSSTPGYFSHLLQSQLPTTPLPAAMGCLVLGSKFRFAWAETGLCKGITVHRSCSFSAVGWLGTGALSP